MPGTHAAVLPRLCRAVTALLAGLAIVVLAPVFACVDAGTPHHEGAGSLRGSTLAVALVPAPYAEAAPEHPAVHTGDHLDAHAGHADCSEACCEPSAALPHAVVRDEPADSAAHPAPVLPAPALAAPRAAGEVRAAPPHGGGHPAGRLGTALLRLVCVSRT